VVLDTALKMSKKNTVFPWFYFFRTLRFLILTIVFSLVATFTIFNMIESDIKIEIAIIAIVIIIVTIILSLFTIRPMQEVQEIVQNIKLKMDHRTKLKLLYKKDEWSTIKELLKMTEGFIKKQQEDIQDQLIQSETLIHSFESPVVILDPFYNCKNYNQGFQRMLGSDQKDSYTKNKIWSVLSDKTLQDVFEKALKNNSHQRYHGFHFQKQSTYYDISINPLRNNKNEAIGLICVFYDITKSKLNEKMRVDFVANVSHEIRTPLTSIKGYTQLLEAQKEDLPLAVRPILEKIDSNSDKLKDLFDNLLKLSVIESKFELHKEEVDLESMFQKISANLRGKYMKTPFKLETKLLVKDVFGDAKLLEQAFNNIIDNAIKYGHDSPVILVSSFSHEGKTAIKISDNGVGINKDDLNRIFERFYRTQETSTVEGTGLGLSIVKHIINKHAGHINVESDPGIGTSFTIIL
jgi:two-component system phosphate regulon sensor histidine kinase PhoR